MSLENNIWHIVPVNDLKPHTEICDGYNSGGLKAFCLCDCKPDHRLISKDKIPVSILIIHNSFDGREGIEWANEILSTT
jgi:hypothetical protein